ncbi:MAG: dTMP kinase [bacterium]|nr:dTMP kinase [bacterium]
MSLEGNDGSGKSTLALSLAKALSERGKAVYSTREPGGTELGESIRDLLLSFKYLNMSSKAEMLLYAASRAQHVDEIIRPKIEQGIYVITDRFIDSSLVYQGIGIGLGIKDVEMVNMIATSGLLPDLTILLAIDYAQASERLAKKTTEEAICLDRIESRGQGYFELVNKGYERISEIYADRVVVFDGAMTCDFITSRVMEIIEQIETLENNREERII